MTFETIKKLYINAALVSDITREDTHYYLFDGESYLEIPKEDLTQGEIALLDELFSSSENTSMWYQYLIKEIPIHNRSLISYKVIQFKTNVKKENQIMLMRTLSDFFETVEDAFFFDDSIGMIVVQDQEIDTLELDGFLTTMNDDFSSKSSLYIGEANMLGEQHILNVKEERELFKNSESTQLINTFQNTYLNTLLRPQLQNSHLASQILSRINTQQDPYPLIHSLWNNQANISKTAQDLFLHRNTLIYRMDKFNEEVGLSLRDLDDLLICYLLIR